MDAMRAGENSKKIQPFRITVTNGCVRIPVFDIDFQLVPRLFLTVSFHRSMALLFGDGDRQFAWSKTRDEGWMFDVLWTGEIAFSFGCFTFRVALDYSTSLGICAWKPKHKHSDTHWNDKSLCNLQHWNDMSRRSLQLLLSVWLCFLWPSLAPVLQCVVFATWNRIESVSVLTRDCHCSLWLCRHCWNADVSH